MKRAFPQKIEPVPSPALDSEAIVKQIKQALPESQRKARTSAAMIGLAISMGASGLVLHRQSDRAVAAEPVTAEPTATIFPLSLEVPVDGPTFTPVAGEQANLSASSLNHEADSQANGWQNNPTYQVSATEFANANDLSAEAVQQEQQIGWIPATEESWAAPTAAEIESQQIKERQDLALESLRESSNRLRNSLAEWRSEEFRGSALVEQPIQSSPLANEVEPEVVAEIIPVVEAQEVTVPVIEGLEYGGTREFNNGAEVAIAAPAPAVNSTWTPASATPVISQAWPVVTDPSAVSEPVTIQSTEARSVVPQPKEISRTETQVQPAVIQAWQSLTSPSNGKTQSIQPAVIPTPAQGVEQSSAADAVVGEGNQPNIAIANPSLNSESEKSANAAQKGPEVVEEPDLSKAVVIASDTPVSLASEIHQVHHGDTLDLIAQTYGVESTQIAKANQINDPDFLRVDQQLKIPLAEAEIPGNSTIVASRKQPESSQVAEIAAAPSSTTPSDSQLETVVPSLILPNSSATSRAAFPSAPPLETSEAPRNVILPVAPSEPVTQIAATSINSAAPERDELPSASSTLEAGSSSNNPYLQSLMAEITEMRHKYRSQTANTSNPSAVNTVANVNGVTAPVAVIPAERDRTVAQRQRNQEFNSDRYTQDLQQQMREIQRSRQQTQTPASNREPAVVLPNERPVRHVNPELDSTRQATENLRREINRRERSRQQPQQPSAQANTPAPASVLPQTTEQVVATSPMPPGTYLGQPSVGQMVSPELPPLPGADTYLPSGSPRFNGYMWPAQGVLTSGYGPRWGRMHKGIDIAGPIGTPIVAAGPGVVTYAGWNDGGYGNLVEIQHPDGSLTLYAHNNRLVVQEGQTVDQGQQIAEMGSTGYSTGPHLHFEFYPAGQGAVNPLAYLPQ